jgi:DNA-binding NarL/FixJ family response regulator
MRALADHPITPREIEVLHLVAQGHSNIEIARRLIVSVKTIERHLYTIYGKLDVDSRTGAIYAMGWVQLPSAGWGRRHGG